MLNPNHETETSRFKRMDAAHGEILDILRERKLATLFQALVDPYSRGVFGYEALTRGPSNSWLHSPQNLFDTARRTDLRLELEFLCAQLAVTRFVEMRTAGRLFINISPDSICEEARFAERFLDMLAAARLAPDRCVIEITEDGLLDDYAEIRSALQHLRKAGCEFAIDDLGAGSSGLRIWSELKPDYVKIDRYFISGIDSDATKAGFVRSIIELGHTVGSRIIAEGVETPEECRELVELGVDRLQGYLFGRPQTVPSAALEHFETMDPASTTPALCAEQLSVYIPPVPPTMCVAELAELFRTDTSRNMLVVAQDGEPLGVVRRQNLFALLSKPLYPEIYNKKRVTAVMESDMFLIDSRLRLEQVSRVLTQTSEPRWTDEFVIVHRGKYGGIGQTMDLLRLITEQQVQAAKHANPLTLLPGNGPIRDRITRLIDEGRGFVICHLDLNYFKPYNDVYGYAQGDQVILFLADLLKRAIAPGIDFVGHIGGDDFVLVMRSPDWRERIEGVLRSFSEGIPNFYSKEHVAQGHMMATDREGEPRRFLLLSISAAALDSTTVGCKNADAAARLLADVKAKAKQRAGNTLLWRTNAGITDLFGAGVEHAAKRR